MPSQKPDLTLGYIAVRLGHITPEQLERAIAAQKKDPRPIGQVLVKLGFLDELTIEKLLILQQGGVGQIMEKERKTLYACPSCAVTFKIVNADAKKKYLCKYCKVAVKPVKKPQTLHKSSTEELEFTDESEMTPPDMKRPKL
ncbi:MAG TPA: hypothetical protein VI643_00415 [Planctomycetota bacterium]|nr:hypothetical protein [Planctomycetota bacterium]